MYVERTIVHVDPHSAGRVMGIVYFAFGLLFLPFLALPAVLGGEGLFAVGVALGMPVAYAALGYLSTAAFCVLYNAIAGRVGGVRLSLGADERNAPAPDPTMPTR